MKQYLSADYSKIDDFNLYKEILVIKGGRAAAQGTPDDDDAAGEGKALFCGVEKSAYVGNGMVDSNKKFGERERDKIFDLWRKYETRKYERQEWDVGDAVNQIY